MRLTKANGPECIHCGCEDSDEITQKEWFGKLLSIRQCSHCHSQFSAEMPSATDDSLEVSAPEIPKRPRGNAVMTYESKTVRCRCPECQEENPMVTKSIPKGNTVVRYHKCSKGHLSKSVEKV